MGNGHARKVFQNLDRDKSGQLSLNELLHPVAYSSTRVFDPKACSLTTLYWFDLQKDGGLSFREFAELEKFVAAIRKKVEKRRKKKKKRNVLRHNVSFSDLDNAHKGETMMFSRLASSGDLHTLETNPTSSPCSSRASSPHHSDEESSEEDEDSQILREVREQISVELLPALNKHVFAKRGRKRFLEWLFKVADWEHDNRISVEELRTIIDAVHADGIDVRALVYDAAEEGVAEAQDVQRVMAEYDTGETGFLTKEEFMSLGAMILGQYEQQEREHPERVGPYILTHTLGEGSYGRVRCAYHHHSHRQKAIKEVKRGNVSDMSQLDCEIQAMTMLRHTNVVQLEEVIESDDHIYLVMELCGGGNLYEQLDGKGLPEPLCRFYFTQLCDAICYCHQSGVCHRDLRLENLLLDDGANLKVADFGQARIFKKGWDLFSTQLVGSLQHISPEQTQGHCYSGEKIDTWSAGIILYVMLTGLMPFAANNVHQLFDVIREAKYEPLGDEVSQEAKDLVHKLLRADPDDRISLGNALEHPWAQGETLRPVLRRYSLVIPCGVTPEEWMKSSRGYGQVLAVLKDMGIHLRDSKLRSDNTLKTLCCIYPSYQVKFSLSISVRFLLDAECAPDQPQAKQLDLQFNLREGGSMWLKKLIAKVHKRLAKIFKLVKLEDFSTDDVK